MAAEGGDGQRAAGVRRPHQIEGVHCVVRVADAPEVLGVAERAVGDQVETIPVGHHHLRGGRRRSRWTPAGTGV